VQPTRLLKPARASSLEDLSAMVKRSQEVAANAWIGQMDFVLLGFALQTTILLYFGDTFSTVQHLVNGRCGPDFLDKLEWGNDLGDSYAVVAVTSSRGQTENSGAGTAHFVAGELVKDWRKLADEVWRTRLANQMVALKQDALESLELTAFALNFSESDIDRLIISTSKEQDEMAENWVAFGMRMLRDHNLFLRDGPRDGRGFFSCSSPTESAAIEATRCMCGSAYCVCCVWAAVWFVQQSVRELHEGQRHRLGPCFKSRQTYRFRFANRVL
jgi:hypothetical protein